jgi:hypothetical protein
MVHDLPERWLLSCRSDPFKLLDSEFIRLLRCGSHALEDRLHAPLSANVIFIT